MAPKARVIDTNNLALQKIAPLIHEIRGERVIVDSDLAQIYGVSTTRLNEQVKRNAERFPTDFAFRLTRNEMANLMSQIAISSSKHGGRRKLPFVFTEHGAIMAANVLNSKQAVQMSVFVVRAFVKLRDTLATHKELAEKLNELERKLGTPGRAIVSILGTIRQMTEPAGKKARAIGFRAKRETETKQSPKTVGLKRARKK
jgi:phage regulator Rha-like protein